MYKHLLVPVDESELSIANVGEAVKLARSFATPAKVTFFHATADYAASGEGSRAKAHMEDKLHRAPLFAEGSGLTVREMTGRLEVPETVHGVMVSRVDPTGAAFSASIRRGFVIMEINRRAVRSLADYQRAVAAAKPGDVLALYCYDPTLQQRTLITVAVE